MDLSLLQRLHLPLTHQYSTCSTCSRALRMWSQGNPGYYLMVAVFQNSPRVPCPVLLLPRFKERQRGRNTQGRSQGGIKRQGSSKVQPHQEEAGAGLRSWKAKGTHTGPCLRRMLCYGKRKASLIPF